MGVGFKTIVSIWMIVFTFITVYAISQNRQAIHKINDTKADVSSLKQTNDALRSFLLTACAVRVASANKETGKQRQLDLEAARGYKQLADLFDGNRRVKRKCVIPQER